MNSCATTSSTTGAAGAGSTGGEAKAVEPVFVPDSEAARRYRESRPMYTEARERMVFEKQEVKRADERITGEIRDHCRPEIEEYIDCTTGRFITVVACRDLAMRMRNCMKKYKVNVDLDARRAEIIAEFEAQGNVLDRSVLARRNNLYSPPTENPTTE